MVFNEQIKSLRLEQGKTQGEVAKAIGITTRNYQRLEAEDSIPSYKSLLALGEYFQVSLDYLTGRTDRREINR